MRIQSSISIVAGAAILVSPIAWWWLTYREVIQYNYLGLGEASLCLVMDTDICRLARALCRGDHPREIINYSDTFFWLAVVLLSSAVLRWAGALSIQLRSGGHRRL
jgi:hypothetical protein